MDIYKLLKEEFQKIARDVIDESVSIVQPGSFRRKRLSVSRTGMTIPCL